MTLGAQLALAAGYATTRAGIGGFLQLTELAWVYVVDVTLLAEPTSLLGSCGTALVFASALAVLRLSTDRDAAPKGAGLREGLLPAGSGK
jgi:drug/metabolite transporter (DMT)-like permease